MVSQHNIKKTVMNRSSSKYDIVYLLYTPQYMSLLFMGHKITFALLQTSFLLSSLSTLLNSLLIPPALPRPPRALFGLACLSALVPSPRK